VQDQGACAAGDAGGHLDQPGAHGGGFGGGERAAGQDRGGALEVVRDRRANQPGVVGLEAPRGQVCQRAVLDIGDLRFK
jgi:hypothetical protein